MPAWLVDLYRWRTKRSSSRRSLREVQNGNISVLLPKREQLVGGAREDPGQRQGQREARDVAPSLDRDDALSGHPRGASEVFLGQPPALPVVPNGVVDGLHRR